MATYHTQPSSDGCDKPEEDRFDGQGNSRESFDYLPPEPTPYHGFTTGMFFSGGSCFLEILCPSCGHEDALNADGWTAVLCRGCGAELRPALEEGRFRKKPTTDEACLEDVLDCLLLDQEELNKTYLLRNFLADMPTVEAIEFLLERMKRAKTNKEFFATMQQG